jgi:two-component system, chemotaxis family, CheB/CheR fusion protein
MAPTCALWCAQLEPYASDNLERLVIEGEPVSLPADLATPVGLVFHELAANAAKYGSLSVVSGRVAVTWTLAARNHDRLLNIIWHEQGGRRSSRRPPADLAAY